MPLTVQQRRMDEKLRHELGPEVAALLDDEKVEDIHCNSSGELYARRRGGVSTPAGFLSYDKAQAAICTIAAMFHAEFTREQPFLNYSLPTGERFNASGPPIVERPEFSIRKPPSKIYSLLDFVQDGVITEQQRSLLTFEVQEGRNIVVSGGTGTGKTTFLNALLCEIDSDERLIIIEDGKEIQSPVRNTLQMCSNERYPLLACLKEALRKRPDRIIIGEVRGKEAFEMLSAMNTGHDGLFASVHANSAKETYKRLRDLARRDHDAPSAAEVMEMVMEAVDVVVYLKGDDTVPAGRKVMDILLKEANENN